MQANHPRATITAVLRDSVPSVDSDLPAPWWSFGKTVLASAALVLVAQGRLRLDEPLPGRPFTLRQLLGHRAGLRCYGGLREYHAAVAAGEQPWSLDELLRRVRAEELAYEPGSGWAYSNVGYALVRTLIEQAAGEPLGPALQRLIFAPLGVAGVFVAEEPADLDGSAWGNARRYHPGWVYHGLLVGPASAAVSFLDRLLSGRPLPPGLLAAMRDAHPVDGTDPGRPWRTTNYGLGLMIGEGELPGTYVGHTGGGPGRTAAVSPGRFTAAAFAPVDEPGVVEKRAMALAHSGPHAQASAPPL